MMTLKLNADRMKSAIAFVATNASSGGVTMRAVTYHVLSTFSESRREKPSAHKQASSVVERIIKDRHVRQAPDLTLHPWDENRKAYAEALERAAHAASRGADAAEQATLQQLACKAWRAAGDENRARTLFLLGVSR